MQSSSCLKISFVCIININYLSVKCLLCSNNIFSYLRVNCICLSSDVVWIDKGRLFLRNSNWICSYQLILWMVQLEILLRKKRLIFLFYEFFWCIKWPGTKFLRIKKNNLTNEDFLYLFYRSYFFLVDNNITWDFLTHKENLKQKTCILPNEI